MKANVSRTREMRYTIPENADEIAWAGFIIWKDPKDGHRHLVIPWEVTPAIDRRDLMFCRKLGKRLTAAIRAYQKEVKAKRDKAKRKGGAK